MTQLDLNYNPTPPVMASHPATSHEAAERVKPKTPTMRTRVWGLLRELGPMTDREIYKAYIARFEEGWTVHTDTATVRARRWELEKEKRVAKTGEERDGMTLWIAQ